MELEDRKSTAIQPLSPSASHVRLPQTLGGMRLMYSAQGLTVAAMVIYGSVAITREQQQAHYIKTQKTLGDLPADTVVPEASGRIGTPTPDFDQSRPQKPSTVRTSTTDSAQTDTSEYYPLAKKDRMKASDFAKRLREAEIKTAKEDDEARARK